MPSEQQVEGDILHTEHELMSAMPYVDGNNVWLQTASSTS